MSHKTIFLLIFSAVFVISVCYTIKNKPQYLVLLGIRGLLSCLLIQFINYLCGLASLAPLIVTNAFSILAGSLLGFPGILLLYLSKMYLV